MPLVDHYKVDEVFREAILKVLNSREFTATGICEKIFDETVYKRAQFTNFTRDWERLESVVLYIREETNKPTLFQDFEYLGKKWLLNPLKKL